MRKKIAIDKSYLKAEIQTQTWRRSIWIQGWGSRGCEKLGGEDSHVDIHIHY